MTSTHVRRAAFGALAMTAVVALAGCASSGGAEEPESAGSTAPADTASPSGSPEASESPSVAPATGLELTSHGLSAHAPEGWEKYTSGVTVPWQKLAAEPGTYNTTLVVQTLTSLNEDQTLEEAAQGDIDYQSGGKGASLKRAGTVMLDGVEFYHNVGRENRNVWVYEYGAPVGDRNALISIAFDKWAHPDKQDREDIVASILASVEVDPNA
ncbi:hypothetical protein GON03_17355 [Nocardioides sp. MAH-18]|uniref:Fibronectin attachment protein n=1 Tax=Nocardioides agri TaxID=2682843 RepID=A0A6L6XW69_9ACTN|nr:MULTISPECIES: hypothetical protein [unclassified Nocardioides]MBA2956111.1 hypothetical protein [Nocardioides sp. CGMCC 1.13656]MVQ50957.1 hypothetical protein [Nocardioides sp. MAH-18]